MKARPQVNALRQKDEKGAKRRPRHAGSARAVEERERVLEEQEKRTAPEWHWVSR